MASRTYVMNAEIITQSPNHALPVDPVSDDSPTNDQPILHGPARRARILRPAWHFDPAPKKGTVGPSLLLRVVLPSGLLLARGGRQRWTYIAVQCIMPEMKLAKDLVAASAGPLVLSILSQGETYGYAILQRVRELSGGRVEWTDGMLYPVLHRLEAQGAITARWRVAENGRKRKYYALKTIGRRVLAEHRQQWELVNGMLATAWAS